MKMNRILQYTPTGFMSKECRIKKLNLALNIEYNIKDTIERGILIFETTFAYWLAKS